MSLVAHPKIVCPQCKMESYNPHDIEHKYCGNCHQFHDEMENVVSQPSRFVRKPTYAQAMQYTVDNALDIVKWLGADAVAIMPPGSVTKRNGQTNVETWIGVWNEPHHQRLWVKPGEWVVRAEDDPGDLYPVAAARLDATWDDITEPQRPDDDSKP